MPNSPDLQLSEQDFREYLDSIARAVLEEADHVTDDQFHMRIVDNAAAQVAALERLYLAIEQGTTWSALLAAMLYGIHNGLGQALPREYHAVRRARGYAGKCRYRIAIRVTAGVRSA